VVLWSIGFGAITASAYTFGGETVIWWREASSGLSELAYFTTKVVADIPNILMASFFYYFAFQVWYVPNDGTSCM
jgi:hypothetical protein